MGAASAVRMSTQDLSFEHGRFIHTNRPYNVMLIYKLSGHLTKRGASCWGRNAAAGFHWGIFSGEDASELHPCPPGSPSAEAGWEVGTDGGPRGLWHCQASVCAASDSAGSPTVAEATHSLKSSYSWVSTGLCLGSTAVRS